MCVWNLRSVASAIPEIVRVAKITQSCILLRLFFVFLATHRLTHSRSYSQYKMLLIVAVVALSMCLSACAALWAIQIQLRRLRSRFGYGHEWAQRTVYCRNPPRLIVICMWISGVSHRNLVCGTRYVAFQCQYCSKLLLGQPRPLCIRSREVESCSKRETISRIVNSCPQTKLDGGLQRLHSADDVATEWLKTHGSLMPRQQQQLQKIVVIMHYNSKSVAWLCYTHTTV